MRFTKEGGYVVAFLVGIAPLLAGPPFRTDDPEPVELGHLELYTSWMETRTQPGSFGLLPQVEFNAGILPDTQFHLALAQAYASPNGGPVSRGFGDTEVGIKYRFLHETEVLPQIGIFPLVELPTGSPERGLGAGHTQVYLPLWIQKTWGSWTSYGGYGWWRNPGPGQRNWNYAGGLLQREVSELLTLGAEVYRATAATSRDRDSSGFSVGAILNPSTRHHVLMSAGRSLSGSHETHFYLGYQLTAAAPWLGGQRKF